MTVDDNLLAQMELAAIRQANRGRNEALAIISLLLAFIAFGAVLSVGIFVEKEIAKGGLDGYVNRAEILFEEISDTHKETIIAHEEFVSTGEYSGLVARIESLEEDSIQIRRIVLNPLSSCRTETGVFSDSKSGDSCSSHFDWVGEASCDSGEVMTSVRIVATEEKPYRCAFKATCCSILALE